MNKLPIVREVELLIMGEHCQIQVFGRENGTYFALTKFSDTDAIISDGRSIDEVLTRHKCSLPVAIDSRRLKQRLMLETLKRMS